MIRFKSRPAEEPRRLPNRAERRASRHLDPNYARARMVSLHLRRAFGGWKGAYRPSPWGRG